MLCWVHGCFSLDFFFPSSLLGVSMHAWVLLVCIEFCLGVNARCRQVPFSIGTMSFVLASILKLHWFSKEISVMIRELAT